MGARAVRVRTHLAHCLAARGLPKDRADRPLSLPQAAGELYSRRRERKGSRCGAADGASSAAGALHLISDAPETEETRGTVESGVREDIGTDEVFSVRVPSSATM